MKRLNSFRRGERIFRNVVANVAEAAIGVTAELLTAVGTQKTSKSGHAQLRDTWFRSASSTCRGGVLDAQLAAARRSKEYHPYLASLKDQRCARSGKSLLHQSRDL